MITKQNIEMLKALIDEVTAMVNWTNKNLKSSERAETFKKLVEQRRELKRKYRSLKANPTIAAYGESQKGKSYIISSLLSSPGKPLMVEDENGQKLDFIENFNRKTDNQESTGVVTRFTTEKVSDFKDYPIRIAILSIADLITMLADCYMEAITDGRFRSEADMAKIGQDLKDAWIERPEVQSDLTEDEVGDIKDFLMNSHKKDTNDRFVNSGWFDCVALVIRHIPAERWPEVFAPLWGGNEAFTKFLGLAIKSYQAIQFSETVYINSKPVLNDGNDGAETLMAVVVITDESKGIKAFYEGDGRIITATPVCLPSGQMITLDKAMLSIMTSEVVYHVDPETLRQDLTFDFSGIRASNGHTAEENISHLKALGLDKPTNRDFLIRDSGETYCFDLLDFPGARVVGNTFVDANIAPKLDDFLLREKVSYLFRKYSGEQRLSILLLCNDEENVTTNLVTPQLSRWIHENIGSNASERQIRLREYGLSPLFLIGTKYNRDLVVEVLPGKPFKLDQKVFQRRLKEKMYDELISPKLHDWFDNWTPGRHFDNTYLLRDYKYSSDLQKKGACHLFHGYPGPEKEELNSEERAQIKEVFLNDQEGVRRFFYDPELAWDTTSTIGNDGTYYLIKQISAVTDNAEKARGAKFDEDIKKALDSIYNIIKGKYHEGGELQQLEESISKGKRFDFVIRMVISQQHEDFFGRFIQYLQMTPNYVNSVFSEIVYTPIIVSSTILEKYELLVKGVEEAGEHFDPKDEQHNLDVLWRVFGVRPGDPLLEGIDLELLFTKSYKDNRSASFIMAKTLIDRWMQRLHSPDLYFTQVGFNSTVLSQFLNNFESMASFVGLRTAIADAISEYVDFVSHIKDERLALISDVAASIYNNFVMDMGYSLLHDPSLDRVRPEGQSGKEILADVRKHNAEHGLKLSLNYELVQQQNSTDRDVMAQIFQQLEGLGNSDDGAQYMKTPSYVNLKRWIEMVKISYIANCKAVDYDLEANDKLGSIITAFKSGRENASV